MRWRMVPASEIARDPEHSLLPRRYLCELRDEWRSWSPEKRADRIFMVCPGCGHPSSHITEEA